MIRYLVTWHAFFECLYLHIRSISPQMVLAHNWRSTWIRPMRELRDALLGGHYCKTMEREPTINTPPHLLRHPHSIQKTGSGSKSVRISWEDMILPGVEHRQNLRQSECDQRLGKIECVLSLYNKVRWKWDNVYLLRGLLVIYSPSLCPPPVPWYLCTTTIAPWWCTSRPSWSVLGEAVGDCDWVNSEMHVEAGIERVWRCISRQRDPVTSEMYLEDEIESTRRCIWKL